MYKRFQIPLPNLLTCFLTVVGGTAYADLHAFLIHYLYDIVFFEIPLDAGYANQ